MILDGWGIASKPSVSAIDKARTPFMDSVVKKYAHSQLNASGLAVGLPEGQMGNSEVGHMNIGAGRVVYQDLVKINKAIQENELDSNPVIREAVRYSKAENKNIHLIGLVSDGGVHSHIIHLKGLISIIHKMGAKNIFIHALTDGRDTDPKSGLGFIRELQDHLDKTSGNIATITGRYYTMDRDKRWERVKIGYDALVSGTGERTPDIFAAMQKSYAAEITDEFIKPIIHTDNKGNPLAKVEPGDVVFCFNFRTDRLREITIALTQKDMPEHGLKTMDLYYITMTNYDDSFKNVRLVYEKDNLDNTIGEILSKAGRKQIRIAETEKYPHVTFFFNGGREAPFAGESRILCPSPKVATYDLKPEMSAFEVRDKILPELDRQEADFVCLNFANADMVGHTGVFEAAVKACETVDQCAGEVVNRGLKNGYSTIIIADHGNSDYMINDDGSPNTAHTTNPVPCILVDDSYKGGLKNGKLGDLAPTILSLMNIPVPKEMTGTVLLK